MPFSHDDNDDVKLKGGTDETPIGNVGDRLKVDTDITVVSDLGAVGGLDKNLRYEDMNASTGGVARETYIGATWTTLYQHSGSGYIYGYLIHFENLAGSHIRFIVDGTEIFGSAGLSGNDLTAGSLYNLADKDIYNIGLRRSGGVFIWGGNCVGDTRMRYNTSVEIRVTSDNKRFKAGLMALSKEP